MTSLQQLSEELVSYQVSDITIDSFQSTLRMGFVHQTGSDYFVIEVSQLSRFQITKDPEDAEGCFVVGSAAIRELDENARAELFTRLGVRFGTADLQVRYHMKIDGDATIDILCGRLLVLRPAP